MGRECPGEIGKHRLRGFGAGALQQGRPPETHQARLLPSPRRPARIRPRPAVDRHHGSWLLRPAHIGRHALVDPARPWPTAPSSGQRVIQVWEGPGLCLRTLARGTDQQTIALCHAWHTKYFPVDTKGKRHAWRIAQGKRSVDHRMLWDINRRQYRKTGIVYLPVGHPPGTSSGHPWILSQPSGLYRFVGKFLFTNFEADGEGIRSSGRDCNLATSLKLPPPRCAIMFTTFAAQERIDGQRTGPVDRAFPLRRLSRQAQPAGPREGPKQAPGRQPP